MGIANGLVMKDWYKQFQRVVLVVPAVFSILVVSAAAQDETLQMDPAQTSAKLQN